MKRFCNWIGRILALPLIVWARGSETRFVGAGQMLSLMPGTPGRFVRRGFYRATLEECGPDFDIHFGSWFSHSNCRIGPEVWIGAHYIIGSCVIHGRAKISSHVSVLSGSRQHAEAGPTKLQRIEIGKESWIGERAVVAADVGDHTVVGMGAVVNKPVADGMVVAGVPARTILTSHSKAGPSIRIRPDSEPVRGRGQKA